MNGKKAFHEGLDIAYPTGTKIHAVSGGVVTSVVYSKTGYGHHVRVDCGNGVTVLYAHCSKILVTKGAKHFQQDRLLLRSVQRACDRSTPSSGGAGKWEKR